MEPDILQQNKPTEDLDTAIQSRADALFAEHRLRQHQHVDRMFAVLMLVQWAAAIAAAVWFSPRTWSGSVSQTHIHVWAALLLGGAITLYPVFLTVTQPGKAFTRHIIAGAQLLMSALLIHLTGGRLETHFHVFGSLAFLAFYRDWRVMVTATVVTAADHLLRGAWFPQSLYGLASSQTWRWLEHAGWVLFEDVFLIISCQWGTSELHHICERDARLETSNTTLEQKVQMRTASLQEANKRLEALVTTDPLTSLPNHRSLVDIVDREIERSARYNRACTLLFLDLDHFKALNDGCGHAAGDSALKELGGVIKQCLRGIDTVGRWGGEEFIALLPETEAQQGMEIAERVRQAVSSHLFAAGGGIRVTCSLGAATYPTDALNRSDLTAAADRAMYAAKRLGRNQVRAFTDPSLATLEAGQESSREEVALLGTVEALASLVEARDAYTSEHTNAVANLARRIAEELGLKPAEIRLVELVGKLHDIGKVAIPDSVLQKPGKLTPEEWTQMQQHPVIGAEVVSRIPGLRVAAPGIRSHHERWDGTGYPDGLSGTDIPLIARIVAVADVYNAITTTRVYRPARSHAQALAELRRCAGSQFDPVVVDAAERVLHNASDEVLEDFIEPEALLRAA